MRRNLGLFLVHPHTTSASLTSPALFRSVILESPTLVAHDLCLFSTRASFHQGPESRSSTSPVFKKCSQGQSQTHALSHILGPYSNWVFGL